MVSGNYIILPIPSQRFLEDINNGFPEQKKELRGGQVLWYEPKDAKS